MKCCIEGCESPVKHRNMCGKHYKREWRHGNANKTLINMNESAICSVEDCNNPAKNKTLCKLHYTRFWRYGRTELIRVENGGRSLSSAGYILRTVNGVRQYEHISMAEKALGRPLPKEAVVHHMNNVSWDNETPLNLVICPDQAYHMLLHKRMRDLGYSK